MLERLYLFLDQLGEVGILTRDFFRYLFRRPFETRALLDQLDSVGVRSLNVVNLTAIFSGMVLALQMGQFLEKFGAKIYVSRIMGLSLLREMGPVLSRADDRGAGRRGHHRRARHHEGDRADRRDARARRPARSRSWWCRACSRRSS